MQEKEQTILGMQKQIEELKRKSEQGSQQFQGEVQELQLEALFAGASPTTRSSRCQGRVWRRHGSACAALRSALRQNPLGIQAHQAIGATAGCKAARRPAHRQGRCRDHRLAGAAQGRRTFDQIDGVWISTPECAVALAMALRHALIEVHGAQSGEGQQTKMEMMYQYLTGPRFRHRVQAIVENSRHAGRPR